MNIVPVVLCGGAGTRLWPLSREGFPKQFHSLVGQHTLFQQSLLRAKAIANVPPIVVSAPAYRFLIQSQAAAIGVTLSDLLLEPSPKSTAPAIALACLAVTQRDPNAVVVAMPADHHFDSMVDFEGMVKTLRGAPLASHLVTFGVRPKHAAVGYGYLQQGEALGEMVYAVKRFVEKPDQAHAACYLADGSYWWNSGLFAFSVTCYMAALSRFQPDMHASCEQTWLSRQQDSAGWVNFDEAVWESCPADSVDYAVMEHADAVAMVPLHAAWSDVGSWSSLHDELPHDANGNAVVGDVLIENGERNLVYAQSRLVAASGLCDHVVVETADSVLVVPRGEDERVKALVQSLKAKQRAEAIEHLKVRRPWGSYETLIKLPGYQVKRIVVDPGGCLSLQRHRQRSEHWVVVKGCARVQVGEAVWLMKEGESTDIPVGVLHRLANESACALELVEVQLGVYLGEDDIERLEDHYGRLAKRTVTL